MEINWEVFTPFEATFGGMLIGVSASIILLYQGKVAGISGILGGFFRWPISKIHYRTAFLGGLLIGGYLISIFLPQAYEFELSRTTGAIVTAGLLVGFGTQLGSGCTSGHGVCGLSRLSKRSLVSVCTFMLIGFLTSSSIAYFWPLGFWKFQTSVSEIQCPDWSLQIRLQGDHTISLQRTYFKIKTWTSK